MAAIAATKLWDRKTGRIRELFLEQFKGVNAFRPRFGIKNFRKDVFIMIQKLLI